MGYIKRTFFEIYLKWAIIWEVIKYHGYFYDSILLRIWNYNEYLFSDLLKWDI